MKIKYCNDYILRKATLEDIPKIVNIMKEVYDKLEDKALYICNDSIFVQNRVMLYGFGIVALDSSGTIIGFLLCSYPSKSNKNMGIDIALDEKDLSRVIHMDNAAVLEEHRGNGLEKEMLLFAEQFFKEHIKYALLTVAPDNKASCKSVEKAGYTHMITKLKYGNYKRRIYCKYFEVFD